MAKNPSPREERERTERERGGARERMVACVLSVAGAKEERRGVRGI